MYLEKWVKNLKKKVEWYDFSLIKLTTFLLTLFLITAWPAFLEFVLRFDWYWYLILAIVFAIPTLRKMCGK